MATSKQQKQQLEQQQPQVGVKLCPKCASRMIRVTVTDKLRLDVTEGWRCMDRQCSYLMEDSKH